VAPAASIARCTRYANPRKGKELSTHDHLLQEQIDYYRARAGEYDEWFYRKGRYNRGDAENAAWFDDVAEAAGALAALGPIQSALELAAGTGLWTQRLAQQCATVTAVDASPEVIAINQGRVTPGTNVNYLQQDLFSWRPTERYDLVFFSFWLSHVPPERFAAFWEMVRGSLSLGGRAFLIDSLYTDRSTARDHTLAGPEATSMLRRLNDGREYHIVKVFYDPQVLETRLATLGWQASMHASANGLVLYGSATSTTTL
jgi:demethylmenaquinone methyltransferase/2-methoxy-6-polyprenyl-1,4-benzoquinol methylase